MSFAVKLHKGDFLGRAVQEQCKATGVTRKLCCLVLDDSGTVVLGGESLLDKQCVLRRVTSGGYGCIVCIRLPAAGLYHSGYRVEVQLFGQCYGAMVMKEPLYAPKNEKIKA